MIFFLKFFNKRKPYLQASSKRNFAFSDEFLIDTAIMVNFHQSFCPLPIFQGNEVESIDRLTDLIFRNFMANKLYLI